MALTKSVDQNQFHMAHGNSLDQALRRKVVTRCVTLKNRVLKAHHQAWDLRRSRKT